MADGCLAVVSGCQWLSACGLIHVFVYSEARLPMYLFTVRQDHLSLVFY